MLKVNGELYLDADEIPTLTINGVIIQAKMSGRKLGFGDESCVIDGHITVNDIPVNFVKYQRDNIWNITSVEYEYPLARNRITY